MTLQVSTGHVVSDLGHVADHNAIVTEIKRLGAILATTGQATGLATLDANGILSAAQRPPTPPPPPSPFDTTHLPVLVFVSASARNSTFTSPVDGQIVWLQNEKRYEQRMNGAWQPYGVFVDDGNPVLQGARTAGKPVYFWGGYTETVTGGDGKIGIGVPASTPNGPVTAILGHILQPSQHTSAQVVFWSPMMEYGESTMTTIRYSCRDDTASPLVNKPIGFVHFGWYQ